MHAGSNKSLKKILNEQLLLEYDRDKTWKRHGQAITDHVAKLDLYGNNHYSEMKASHAAVNGREDEVKHHMMSHFEKHDPTPNKQYVQHIARIYSKGGVKMEDIGSRMKPALDKFHDLTKRKIIPTEHRDIGRYKSLSQLEDIVDAHKENTSSAEESAKHHELMKSPEHSEYNDHPTFTHVKPKTIEAATHFGKGTRWCTATENPEDSMFDHYNSQGPLHILRPKKPAYEGEKYQYHYASGDMMNEKDEPVDTRTLRNNGHYDMANHIDQINAHNASAMNNPTPDHEESEVRAQHAEQYATGDELTKALSDPSTYVRSGATRSQHLEPHHLDMMKNSKDETLHDGYYRSHASSDEITNKLKDLNRGKFEYYEVDKQHMLHNLMKNPNFSGEKHGEYFDPRSDHPSAMTYQADAYMRSYIGKDHLHDMVKHVSNDPEHGEVSSHIWDSIRHNRKTFDGDNRKIVANADNKHVAKSFYNSYANSDEIHAALDTDKPHLHHAAMNSMHLNSSHIEKVYFDKTNKYDDKTLSIGAESHVDAGHKVKHHMIDNFDTDPKAQKMFSTQYHFNNDHFDKMVKHPSIKVRARAARVLNDGFGEDHHIEALAKDKEASRYLDTKKYHIKRIVNKDNNMNEGTLIKYKPSNVIDNSESGIINEFNYQVNTRGNSNERFVKAKITNTSKVRQKHNQKEKAMYHTSRALDALRYGRSGAKGINKDKMTGVYGNSDSYTGTQRLRRLSSIRKNIGESAYLENRKAIHDMHAEVGKSLAGKERHPEIKVMDLHRSKKHAHAAAVLDRLLANKKKK